MLKNYFFLNRQILELKEVIINKKILSVFTQEKDKLMIELEDNDQLFLEICVNHSLPYILFKDFYIRAKKNSLELFESLKGKSITNVLIAESDRVVALTINDDAILFFTIRGKFTNVYLKSNNAFHSFKKTENEDLINIETDLINKHYINEFNLPEFTEEDYYTDQEKLKIKYPFIGKEIYQYAKDFETKNLIDGIIKTIEIIKSNNPVVLPDYNNYEIKIGFKDLPMLQSDSKYFEFENLNEAITFYIKEYYHLSTLKEKKEFLLKHIDKELRRISGKQNNLIAIIERGNKEEEYKHLGNLLLININKLNQGMNSIVLSDIYDNDKSIEIKLDPKLSPKQNVNRYFEKAKESRIQYQKAKELIAAKELEKVKLLKLKNQISNSFNIREIEQIAKKLRIKMKPEKNTQENVTEKFKHYLIDGKYKVYVGKDSKSNDLLTLKFAKQNDYWFHARAVPGSHVVLRVENTKEPIPKSVLKKVASLAAYHSKAKTAGVVPVSYTLKKFVIKRKGMESGKVALNREETLLVPPEIPDGAVYIES
ncbi:MAG: NFACT RNA binding domain-containing protein [Ignavibacterium sp.]